MRKKLFIAAAIILLLLFSFFGFLSYRQYSAYKVPVHAAAQTIIKVNVDDFIKMFVSSYGINFKKKITGRDKKEKEPSLNTGIWVPGSVFVYNLASLRPTTLFCSIPVVDQQDFILYAQKKWKLTWQERNGIYFGSNTAGTLTAACNKDFISLAWSPAKENVQSYLQEILSSQEFLKQHAAVAARLKDQASPLVAINGQSEATLNFSGNELMMHASLDSLAGIRIPANFIQQPSKAETHSYISLNAFLSPSLFKTAYNIKNYQLATDSILANLQGYINLQLGPNQVQKDSITSYEYDDNFEKVARLSVTDVQVPSMQLSVKASPGLLPYMQAKQIVSKEMELNREVFPLYQVKLQQQNNLLSFNTAGKFTNQTPTAAENFLDVKIDIAKTAAQLNLPFLDAYLKNMLELQMQGTRKQEKLVIDGKILFRGTAIKEIIDLIKIM